MVAEGSSRRIHAGGIRVRTTAGAVAVVGAALVVAAIATIAFMDRSLRDQVRSGAMARATMLAGEPSHGPVVTGGDREEEFVQVLGPDGGVRAASSNVEELPALVEIRAGETRTIGAVPFEDGPFLVVALGDGDETVVVGRALEDARETVATLIGVLVLAIPLLLLVVAVVTWRVVGRALAPVEAIREEVESISSEELHRRVPDPQRDDEIARLASTMNRMLDRLEQGQARQRRFVSDASHELRSPVASIRQHAEVALHHPDRTDLGSLAEVAHEESLRLQRIVEDLLLLSQVDEGTIRLRTEAVDLDDLVLEEAARLRAATDLRVESGRVEGGRVPGDRGTLARLLRNLTENAVRHARSAVALSLAREGELVVLTVEDDGPGIPEAERARVFDRFVRLEDARERDSGGSGLGLSIAREIARLHGGEVVARRSSLGGARLDVRIPAVG